MPLTPLPQDNTKRYFLVYTVDGTNHSMMSRASSSFSDATAVSHMQAVAVALQDKMGNDATFLGVEVAAQGSNVRNPIAGFTPVTGTGGSRATFADALSICIAGRAPSGRKTKVFLYGTAGIAIPANYEEDPLTTAELQGWQGLLNSQSDFWLAIDGTKPTWYFRATFNWNDHWVRVGRV